MIKQIVVLGRQDLPRAIPPQTALLSVCDPGRVVPSVTCSPMLCLAFDDVDPVAQAVAYERQPFTLAQAQIVMNFSVLVATKFEALICQCEHGISRSAALALAIAEGLGVPFEPPFDNGQPRYRPNLLVYRLTCEAFAAVRVRPRRRGWLGPIQQLLHTPFVRWLTGNLSLPALPPPNDRGPE